MRTNTAERYRNALCIKKRRHAAALEIRRVHRIIAEHVADRRVPVRVVNESGEDFLDPSAFFLDIALPQKALSAFSKKSA